MAALTIWFTGLPASGKTTIARQLAHVFDRMVWLDGDIFRQHVSFDLGFSQKDRTTHLKRVIGVCKILNGQHVGVIASFISPTRHIRQLVKEELNAFIIFLNTPIGVCIERDPKGLYKKALVGLIPDFTGIDSQFEQPIYTDLTLNTTKKTVKECARCIIITLQDKNLI